MYRPIGEDAGGVKHDIAAEKKYATSGNSGGWKKKATAKNMAKPLFPKFEKVFIEDMETGKLELIYESSGKKKKKKKKKKEKKKENSELKETVQKSATDIAAPDSADKNAEIDPDDMELKSLSVPCDMEFIKNVALFFSNMKYMRERLKEDIRHEDLVECDLMHAYEFFDLDSDKDSELGSLMKESRLRRRKAKDLLTVIDKLGEFNGDPEACLYYICNLDHRNYEPRVLDSLFERYQQEK